MSVECRQRGHDRTYLNGNGEQLGEQEVVPNPGELGEEEDNQGGRLVIPGEAVDAPAFGYWIHRPCW